MPAMPEPSPKVSASTHGVRMPIAAAMRRFCVTARICRPERRALAARSSSSAEHDEREDDDPEPVPGDARARRARSAPRIQRGLPTSLVGRAEDRAHRLLQDQDDAPGGEQRLERPAVEEADDAALDERCRPAPATRNATGSAMTSEQSNRPGSGRADQLLHDVGGVGAEHHHLAMRHVDDAHHAEGDGEADRGEQQHRAERDAVPDVLRRRPRRRASADRCRRRAVAAALTSPSERWQPSIGSDGQRIAVAALARPARSAASLLRRRRVGGRARCAARGLLHRALDCARRSRRRAPASSSGERRRRRRRLNMRSAAASRAAGSGLSSVERADARPR